jgi:hypothetical protein
LDTLDCFKNKKKICILKKYKYKVSPIYLTWDNFRGMALNPIVSHIKCTVNWTLWWFGDLNRMPAEAPARTLQFWWTWLVAPPWKTQVQMKGQPYPVPLHDWYWFLRSSHACARPLGMEVKSPISLYAWPPAGALSQISKSNCCWNIK